MRIPSHVSYLQRFINYFKRNFLGYIPIQREIDNDELIVRGIVTPLFFNKRKELKPTVFLPPGDSTDVSVLRHLYTDDHFCKQHSKSLNLGTNTYCGLATFLANHIGLLFQTNDFQLSAILRATPLNHNREEIVDSEVYVNDVGLPMHADIIYSVPTIRGETNTNHRMIAEALLKTSNYFPDPDGNSDVNTWNGKRICWEPIEEGATGPRIQQ